VQDPGGGRQRPHDAEADEILLKKGIFVIPDVLCNAGGVTAATSSGAGLQSFFWTEDEVNQRLDQIMTKAFHQVHDIWVKENPKAPLTMRQAAYMLAVKRVLRQS